MGCLYMCMHVKTYNILYIRTKMHKLIGTLFPQSYLYVSVISFQCGACAGVGSVAV